MTLANDSPSSYLRRIQWRENAFQWLREKRQYSVFELDSCLKKLEENPVNREAALAAFWGAYLANELPSVLSDLQQERIRKLLDYGSPHDLRPEDIKYLAFVKLHLAGLLIICLLRPDYPISETPSMVTVLEKALEAYMLAEPPAMDIDDPLGWGKRLLSEDLLGFSAKLLGSITRIELSLIRADQRSYEEALYEISEGAWGICATTVGDDSGQLPSFAPYLPHSGHEFDVQEAINIFEEIRNHARDIKDWEQISNCCEILRYLGFFGLYDPDVWVRPFIAEGLGAAEYWGRAATFAEGQMRLVTSPLPVVTKDMMEYMETKERLKRDFFGNTWDELTAEAQKILVGAEVEWMHNRIDNMVREIRPMLELALPSIFPFLEPTTAQRDSRLILTRMRDELLTNRVVRASIDGLKIDNRDKAWVNDELPKLLQKVIDTRNYFEKEQHLPGKKSGKNLEMTEKAVSIHRELLGIGCEGMLPRLMKIKRAISPKK